MQIKWKYLLAKIFVWLMSEIILTFLGIDNLADYSEFIFKPNLVISSRVILILPADWREGRQRRQGR